MRPKNDKDQTAIVQAQERRDIDMRNILGMRFRSIIDTDSKLQEPKPAPGVYRASSRL